MKGGETRYGMCGWGDGGIGCRRGGGNVIIVDVWEEWGGWGWVLIGYDVVRVCIFFDVIW